MADENETAVTLADESVNLDASVEVETKEKPEAESAKGDEGETKEAGETAGEEQPKKLSGSARAKLRETRLLNELSEAQHQIDELSKKPPAQAASEEKEPVEADFSGDFFAYQQAATAFKAGKAVRDALREDRLSREQSQQSTRQAEIVRERAIAHSERVEDARGVIADFDTVMKEMDGVQVRQDVIDEIMSSDKSALLAYHLAKNPDKLQSLNRMTGKELAREMGRLEGSVRMPAANKQTKAPPPLTTLKGGASGSFDPEKASMDDYVAKRQAGWKG